MQSIRWNCREMNRAARGTGEAVFTAPPDFSIRLFRLPIGRPAASLPAVRPDFGAIFGGTNTSRKYSALLESVSAGLI